MPRVEFPGGGTGGGVTAAQVFLDPDVLANRPAASKDGRVFYATDQDKFYRDNGTIWVYLPILGDGDLADPGSNGIVERTSAGVTTAIDPTTFIYTDDIGVTVQGYDIALDTLRISQAGLTVPRRSLDLFRGGFGPHKTSLTAAVADTTGTLWQFANSNIFRGNGINEVVQVDSEQVLVTGVAIVGGVCYGTVRRGVNGTTAATHSSGAAVVRKTWMDVVILGDSTVQGSTHSSLSTGPWDNWPNRAARALGDAKGGLLGAGFYPMWRCGGSTLAGATSTNTASEWTLTGSGWQVETSTNTWDLGPFLVAPYNTGSSKTATWTRPAGLRVQQVDIFYVDQSAADGSFSYSLDGGTTWIDVTCTLPHTTTLKKVSVACQDPTSIIVRCATAAGTSKTCIFVGVDVWSTVPVWGVTKGIKVHNLGYDGQTLQNFLRAQTPNGITLTTDGSTGAVVASGAFFASTMVNRSIQGAGIPAGTYISAYTDSTHVTLSQNTTAAASGVVFTVAGSSGDTGGNPNINAYSRTVTDALINDGTHSVSTTSLYSPTAAFTANDVGKAVLGSGITSGTYISTYVDSSHVTMSTAGSTVASAGIVTVVAATGWNRLLEGDAASLVPDLIISGFWTNDMDQTLTNLGGTAAAVNAGITNNLNTALNRWTAFANVLGMVPYEQGSNRLDGTHSSSADQATYRAACAAAYAVRRNLGGLFGASGNAAAAINMYDAWSAEGNVGSAACATDGLIDTGDTSYYHPGPNGGRSIGGRVSRVLVGGQ